LWKTGQYRNYSPDELVEIIAKMLAQVPPWTRIYRIQRSVTNGGVLRSISLPNDSQPSWLPVSSLRDIPMPLVTAGVENGNLRELVLKRMHELDLPCRDVRTREVGIKQIHQRVRPDQVRVAGNSKNNTRE